MTYKIFFFLLTVSLSSIFKIRFLIEMSIFSRLVFVCEDVDQWLLKGTGYVTRQILSKHHLFSILSIPWCDLLL